jgi:putative GTP pyrophosphokinase
LPDTVYLPPGFKDELLKKYSELKVPYEELVDEVLYTLRKMLKASNVKVHSLDSREGKIKNFESFFGKIIRKDILFNPFDLIEDIAGVRIICLYRKDLYKIESMIAQEFEIVKIDTSRTRAEAPFGYASDHYIVKLSKNCKGPRYDNIKDLKCEIQVRTILMDAWATVSHHLDYKQEIDIPRELRADFNGLSGLFYVADTHFELFKEGATENREKLKETIKIGELSTDLEINLDTLLAYLQWKFPERKIKKIESDIIHELSKFGYHTLSDLNDKVQIILPFLKEIECKNFTQDLWQPRWAPSGLIRIILDITDEKYGKRWNRYRNNAKHTFTSDFGRSQLALIDEYRPKISKN